MRNICYSLFLAGSKEVHTIITKFDEKYFTITLSNKKHT